MRVSGEVAAASIETRVELPAVLVIVTTVFESGIDGLQLGGPVGVQLEPGIEARNLVDLFAELPFGIENADATLLRDLAKNPQDANVRRFPGQSVVGVEPLTRRLVVDHQRSDTPWSLLAREAQTRVRIRYAPGEYQRALGVEVIRVLDEERTPLVEAHLETLVHRHLGFVRLHLAEVRVQGGIQHQAVLKHELGVQPDVLLGVFVEGRTACRT